MEARKKIRIGGKLFMLPLQMFTRKQLLLILMKEWKVIECTEDTNIIQSTLLFKLKCFPDDLIKKLKAWFSMLLFSNGQQFV